MKQMLMLVVGMMLFATPAFAADVDGKWSGMIETPMGPVNVGFTFKADGASLNGSTTTPDGGDVSIKEGKIDGNKIAFTVALDFGGMPLVLTYTGVVSPDAIKLIADFMGMPFEFTVTKAK